MKRNQKKRDPEQIGKMIELLINNNSKIRQHFNSYDISDCWKEVTGEKIASISKFVKFEKSTLYIKVENSVWKAELFYMKQELITRINKKNGKNILKDIIFI